MERMLAAGPSTSLVEAAAGAPSATLRRVARLVGEERRLLSTQETFGAAG